MTSVLYSICYQVTYLKKCLEQFTMKNLSFTWYVTTLLTFVLYKITPGSGLLTHRDYLKDQ